LHFPTYANFQLATPSLSKKTGGLLTWEGTSFRKEDGMVLIFEDEDGTTFSVNHAGITRGTKFEIRPAFIASLKEGKGTLRIVHKTRIEEVREKTGIVKEMEYYRKPIEIEIVN